MVKRLSADLRRAELKEYLNSVGPININKSELARKYLVTDKVIAHDLELLIGKTDPADLQQLLWRFGRSYEVALRGSLQAYSKASNAGSVMEIVAAVKAISSITSEYLCSLAKLGYKVDADVASTAKPTVQQLNEFYELKDKERSQIKFVLFEDKPKPATGTPTAVDYADVDFRRPSLEKPKILSPGGQVLIVDETEEDDLEEVTDKEIEEDESLRSTQ